MTITYAMEPADSPEARAVVAELEHDLDRGYPPESQHGYNVERLISEGVAFFLIRVDGVVAGCGGIQLHGTEYGELKRMYVRPAFRGLGLARGLVEQLAAHAGANDVSVIRLETGVHQHEAIGLYEDLGFRRIPPFGEYRPDPLSVFYERSGLVVDD